MFSSKCPGRVACRSSAADRSRRSQDQRKVQRPSELRIRHDVRRRQVRRPQASDRADPGKVREETLVTSTRVRAEINRLTVGTEKRLTVGRMVAELRSISPSASRQRTDHSSRRGRNQRTGHRRLRVAGRLRFQPLHRTRYARQAGADGLEGRVREEVRPAVLRQSRGNDQAAQADPRDARHQDRVGGREESKGRDRRQQPRRREGLRQDFLRRDPDQRGLPRV